MALFQENNNEPFNVKNYMSDKEYIFKYINDKIDYTKNKFELSSLIDIPINESLL
jgi:hypothetical protein